MTQFFANNASTKLVTGVNNTTDFQFSVEAGKGDLFPVVSGGTNFFYVTLEDGAGNVEIWKIITRTSGSDVFSAGSTANREQDGTIKRAFMAGDIVECRLIQKDINDILGHKDAPTAAHAASAISYGGSAGLSATNVEAALDELDTEKSAVGHAHAAADISYAGSTNLSAANVEAALDELDAEKAAVGHAHAASAISYAGSTNLSAANVEAALDELDAEKAAVGSIGSSGLTISSARLAGRTTAAAGAIEEISVGSGLSLSGGVLSNSSPGGGGVTSINGMTGAITISGSNDLGSESTPRINISNASGTVTIARVPQASNPSPGTSLHGDSLIDMADGTTKWLRDLRLGDIVRGEYGPTAVLGIWQNQLGLRDLCAVDSVACTAGHLFASDRGWAAVSKDAYRDTAYMDGMARAMKGKNGIFTRAYTILPEEVIDLEIGMLILRADGQFCAVQDIRRIKTTVEPDNPVVAPVTSVYSLALESGHYFFADGIAVGCIS